MDITSRSQFRAQNTSSPQGYQRGSRLAQTSVGEINQISEHAEVKGQSPERVDAAGAVQPTHVNEYKMMLKGVPLPSMKHNILNPDRTPVEIYEEITGRQAFTNLEQLNGDGEDSVGVGA